MERNAKIRDALDERYNDFIDFCVSIDKQYISELIKSDFIAFRNRLGKTREYISEIRNILDNFELDSNEVSDATNENSINEEEQSNEIPELIQADGEQQEDGLLTKESGNTLHTQNQENANMESYPTSDSKSKRRLTSEKESLEKREEFQNVDWYIPLYDLFNIPRFPYFRETDIDIIGFSVKVRNCLFRSGCQMCDALLCKSLKTISDFKHIGKTTLSEIVKKCKDFSQNIPEGTVQNHSLVKPVVTFVSHKVFSICKSIPLGLNYEISDLSVAELDDVHKLEESYNILGKDLYLLALEKPDKAHELCDSLTPYMEYCLQLDQINTYLRKLIDNNISKDLHILPFARAIHKKGVMRIETFFSHEDRFSDMMKIINNYYFNEHQYDKEFLKSLKLFFECICSGFSYEIAYAYELAITKERFIDVIQLRQAGNTLTEVGNLMNITRERVRQIENDTINKFSSSLKNFDKDIIMFIHALLDGDLIITKDKMRLYIYDEKLLDLLWECIEYKKFNCNEYCYSKKYHAIIFNNADLENAEKIIQSLPEFILQDELEAVVLHAVKEKGISEEMLRLEIKRRYEQYGTFYSEHRPTVVFICDWILKNRFPNGFKISDETDTRRFLNSICEVFGEERSHITPHALDVKVSQVGVLCDRGKYIHPSAVTVDLSFLDDVDKYIENSPKNAIFFNELFEVFKDRLTETQITNHYFLQGVMKMKANTKNTPCPYYFFRNYITKDSSISTTDELDAFIRERGIVHKSEIFAEFPALSEPVLAQTVARLPNVYNIEGGNFIHASQFHIQENDYVLLKSYLTDVTREYPVNIRKVFDDCSIQFHEFMDRNEIYTRGLLFSILTYMFRHEFMFNKPYIANNDDAELSNRGVILSILEQYDEIDIDELTDLLDDRGIKIISLPMLLELVSPVYLRADENLLMKREYAGIDDDVEEDALNILHDAIEANGYLPSSKISDFIWYPSINVPWTTYLLESIVINGDILDYIPYSHTRSNRSLVVYVSKKYEHCDFQSFLLNLVDEEFHKGSFTSKSDMRDWLIEKGLIDKKLPFFLENDQYYYHSDDGRLMKREVEK